MEALNGRVLDRAVHPLDLAVRPRMVRLGQPVLDAVGLADHVEAHGPGGDGVPVPRLLGELDAVVCENGVDLMGADNITATRKISGLVLKGFKGPGLVIREGASAPFPAQPEFP
jgi:hypothetical protein